jgi:hypothetical protein
LRIGIGNYVTGQVSTSAGTIRIKKQNMRPWTERDADAASASASAPTKRKVKGARLELKGKELMGKSVKIKNLKNNQQFNGLKVTVQSYDDMTQRYAVMTTTGISTRVKHANMEEWE